MSENPSLWGISTTFPSLSHISECHMHASPVTEQLFLDLSQEAPNSVRKHVFLCFM